jgi:Mn-containing catalase
MSARTEKIAANKAREAKKRLVQLTRLAAVCNDPKLKGEIAFLTTRTEVELHTNAVHAGKRWRVTV